MTQHEATEKAKRLFGSRAFTYANWSAKPPEFCVGTFAVHTSQGDSPLRGKTWEEAFEKFEGKIDLAGIKVREENTMDDFRSERNYQEALDRVSALVEVLTVIKGHLDPDDPNNYRADDPEGAMDTAFECARKALVNKL